MTQLPIQYGSHTCAVAIFTGEACSIVGKLPRFENSSQQLYPLYLSKHRIAIVVAAMDYTQSTIGAYGEFGIAIPVIWSDKPKIMGPSLFQTLYRFQTRHAGFGSFVISLGVTSQLAHDAGHLHWGYPKYVTPMAFHQDRTRWHCDIGNGHIQLSFSKIGVPVLPICATQHWVTYTMRDNHLIHTQIEQRGLSRVALGGTSIVKIDRADSLLDSLKLSKMPLLTQYFSARTAVLPAGTSIYP